MSNTEPSMYHCYAPLKQADDKANVNQDRTAPLLMCRHGEIQYVLSQVRFERSNNSLNVTTLITALCTAITSLLDAMANDGCKG